MKPETFVNMIKNNPNKAMVYLYLKKRTIKQWILNNSGSAAQAKDILQEGIIILYQNLAIHGKPLNTSPQNYLLGICKNLWLAELRRLKPIVELPNHAQETIPEQPAYEEGINVLGLLNDMGAQCQELLKLCYYQRKSMVEIAEIMAFKTAEVAKSMKYKCIQKARKIAYSTLEKEATNGAMG